MIFHVGMQLLMYSLGPSAGELVALQALTNVLNYLKVQKVDITKVCVAGQLAAIKLTLPRQLTEKFSIAKIKEMLKDIVNSCYDRALEKQKAEGYLVLERGLAMIPLAGIDVPFHSRYL
jgi:fatty acid synthase subunit alpha